MVYHTRRSTSMALAFTFTHITVRRFTLCFFILFSSSPRGRISRIGEGPIVTESGSRESGIEIPSPESRESTGVPEPRKP